MIWRTLLSLLLAPFALAAMWFGGRKQGQTDVKAEKHEVRLEAAKKARETENEVEALDRAALKRRAAVWVRKPER
jgi:hypothetical protein